MGRLFTYHKRSFHTTVFHTVIIMDTYMENTLQTICKIHVYKV